MNLFQNTNDVDLTQKKITLLSPNFYDTTANADFGIGEIGDYLDYDVEDFIKDIDHLLKTLAPTDNKYKNFDFNHESVYSPPPEGINVRYTIMRRGPGTWSAGVGPFEGTVQYKFRLLNVFEDLDAPGYNVLMFGQFLDNRILITPWAKTYTTANRAAHTLEDLLPEYAWFFAKKGLQQIRYEGRMADVFQGTENNSLFGCPLQFYIRTLKLKRVREKKLEEIIIQLQKTN